MLSFNAACGRPATLLIAFMATPISAGRCASGLARQHEILRADRHRGKPRLEKPEPPQHPRKEEEIVRPYDFEGGSEKQPSRRRRRDRDGIAIERNPAHDESSPRVPRVVLPEREEPARPQRPRYVTERVGPLRGGNVMKDAVAECDVQPAARLEVALEGEGHAPGATLASRMVEEACGDIDAGDLAYSQRG